MKQTSIQPSVTGHQQVESHDPNTSSPTPTDYHDRNFSSPKSTDPGSIFPKPSVPTVPYFMLQNIQKLILILLYSY